MQLIWERLRLLHGPSLIRGKLYRIVEAYTVGGGHQVSVEEWCGHQWDMGGIEGPGFADVQKSPEATREEILFFGIPDAEFPPGYDPIEPCVICHPEFKSNSSELLDKRD